MSDFNTSSIFTLFEGEVIELQKGDVICDIHQKINYFYWTIEGAFNYYTKQPNGRESLLARVTESLQPIGWNVLQGSQRFTLKVKVTSKSAKLYKVPEADFFATVNQRPYLLRMLADMQYNLFRSIVIRQTKTHHLPANRLIRPIENLNITHESSEEEIVRLLRRSSFLEQFEESTLKHLSGKLERIEYEAGDLLFRQEDALTGLYILINGYITIDHIEHNSFFSLRSISTPGFIVGWSSLIGSPELCNATIKHRTSLYFIQKTHLEALIPAFELYSKLIWLIDNQINNSISRIVLQKGNEDIISVNQLVEKNKPRLSLSSQLHQVPYLLKEAVTKPRAYEILHQLNQDGNQLERQLASNSLDLLNEDENEVDFVKGLNQIYQVVAERSEKNEDPAMIRNACSDATKELFKLVNYSIVGSEYLPTQPGHIFIYNHLLNHPYYTLPNNFQITLDSHFISAMILDNTYGDPGMRIVRVGNGIEFAHQNYYQALGYINVVSGQVDGQYIDKEKARQKFYLDTENCLKAGQNIIISPEGTSYTTEESPGPFKLGAFNVAYESTSNPLIVPLVVCNFDKRIKKNRFYCKVLPPFDIRELVTTPKNLKEFVRGYQKEFSKEVKRAIEEVDI